MKMHLILAFLLMMKSAWGTTFNIRPFSEFTLTTPNILRGTIVKIEVDHGVSENGEKVIYTYADLVIKEVIKGDISASRIKIRKLGGSKDGVTLEIPGSVDFKEGEESVFFLEDQKEDRSYEVTGMELGRFDLVSTQGKELLKGGLFSYSHPGEHPSTGFRSKDLSENLKPWSISQLRELVQSQKKEVVPEVTKSYPTVSDQSTPALSSSTTVSNQPVAAPAIASVESEDSPLYFNPYFWYSIAILVLTLGVFLALRRG